MTARAVDGRDAMCELKVESSGMSVMVDIVGVLPLVERKVGGREAEVAKCRGTQSL